MASKSTSGYRLFLVSVLPVILTACGGGAEEGAPGGGVTNYTVAGTVSGLSGTAMLQNNGGDDLSISANGGFTFAGVLAGSGSYNVTVSAQPAAQICTVANGAGAVSGTNVTNVTLTCSAISFSVGGKVSGLAGSVVLRNNGGNDLTVSAGGNFTFPAPVAQGSPYAVTVFTQPAGRSCSVANGTGTVAGRNVTNVTVTCAANTFTVGGVVSGLNGTVVLRNNGGNNLTISVNGGFTFAAALTDTSPYAVTVLAQPASQTCVLANGAGALGGANVTNVTLTCTAIAFSVGGTVSGLSGSVVLRNNGGNNLTISANGNFSFPAPVAQGSPYAVTVFTQPPGRSCNVTNGTGTMGGANVTNVTLTCSVIAFGVGGTVSGLSGSVVLRNNGGNDLTISANGNFSFPAPVAQGSPYAVTVFTPPAGRSCNVANGTGTVAGADIINVTVTCTANTFTVGGTVSGLNGTVVLQNNGGNNLTISVNGGFTFAAALTDTSPYAVTVLAKPASQTCAVANGAGTVSGANATGVTVTCLSPEARLGLWSAVSAAPIVQLHVHLLTSGKVLTWGADGTPRTWNPASGAFIAVQSPSLLFCAGHAFLPDGRLLVTGGHKLDALGTNGLGLPDTNIFDPATDTWQVQPPMAAARWYPTNTRLPSGEVVTIAGQDETGANVPVPEVWGGGTWRRLTSAALVLPLYPRTFVAPDGRVFYAGEDPQSRYLDISGTGRWTNGPLRKVGGRDYGSAVMYEPGKILYVGGGDPPTSTAEIIDLNQPSPTWNFTGGMTFTRRHQNATLLPTGDVLVTGGTSGAGFNNPVGGVLAAELWHPATGTWTTLASSTVARMYHGTALLLPDGRVLYTGSGDGGDGANERNYEIYSPPYLFNGARPTFTGAVPASVGYGQTQVVETPNGPGIAKVTLIGLGSVTHAFDQSARLVPLSFSPVAGGVSIALPASRVTAPPGPYMLFLVNANGVPSEGRIMLLQ